MRSDLNVVCWAGCSKITLISCFLYAGYLLFGGFVFSVLESSPEQDVIGIYKQAKVDFMKQHNITEDDLNKFIQTLTQLAARGLNTTTDNVQPNWAFMRSLFFASTLVTTVGYGQYSPSSNAGKVFCIIYASLGIPFTLILFRSLVERFTFLSYKCALNVHSTYFFQEEQHSLDSNGGYEPRQSVERPNPRFVWIYLFLITLVVAIFCCFVFPTLAFYYMEPEWSFLDSIYYCFISLSTIGLGDLVPGTRTHGTIGLIYDLLSSTYIVLGVLYMAYFAHVAGFVSYFDISRLIYLDNRLIATSRLRNEASRLPGDGQPSALAVPAVNENTSLLSGVYRDPAAHRRYQETTVTSTSSFYTRTSSSF